MNPSSVPSTSSTVKAEDPPIRAVNKGTDKSLYPTLGNLDEAIQYAETQLPIVSRNQLVSVLSTIHNTVKG